MNHRGMTPLLIAALIGSTGVLSSAPPIARRVDTGLPVPRRTSERLTKAEKKRARKAAQRARLAKVLP